MRAADERVKAAVSLTNCRGLGSARSLCPGEALLLMERSVQVDVEDSGGPRGTAFINACSD